MFCLASATAEGWAQDQADPSAEADVTEIEVVEPERAAPRSVDEILVTGQKNSVTDVQAESQAITAFSMEELDRSNIVNVDQLAYNVPALHVGQQGVDSIITLRGISTENASPTGEAGVQFIVDGVNYARPSAARVAFFDLEGLQVKRGPQGTRGGKNANAGWIEVTTRKPEADFSVSADYQVGAYGQTKTRAALNIPINEFVQTRFAMFSDDRQGFQRNLFLNDKDRDAIDADDLGFRGQIRLLPSDSLDLLLSYNYYEAKGVGPHVEVVPVPESRQCNPLPPPFGTGYNPLTNFPSFAGCGANPNRTVGQPPNGPFPAPVYAATGFDLERQARFLNFERPETANVPRDLANGAVIQPHRTFLNSAAEQENIFWGWTGTANWDPPVLPAVGETQFKSITGFQVTAPDGTLDPDGTDLDLFSGGVDRHTTQWSQEFQWAGTTPDERLDWISSLFYLHEETENFSDFAVKLSSTQRLTIDQLTENKSFGASLSTTWHVLDNFSVTLGGRYIKDIKRNQLVRNQPAIGSNEANAGLGICNGGAVDVMGSTRLDSEGNVRLGPDGLPLQFPDGVPDDGTPTCKRTYRDVIGDFTLDWWPREENHFYFAVRNGFKSGGFALGESDSRRSADTSLAEYAPEKVWAFTLGSKNSFFDDRLTLNLEAFYYNYRDQQLVLIDGFSVRTDNADDTRMQGIDLEFQAEPFSGLRLGGNISVMDTEFLEYSAVDPIQVLTSANCRAEARSLDPNFRANSPGCVKRDYSGNEVTRSPKFSYTVGAEYDFYLGRFGTVTPRIQFYFQDDTWYRPFNETFATSGNNIPCPVEGANNGCQTRNGKSFLLNGSLANDLQERYHFTDVKVTWRSPSENWSVEGFVQNLENDVVFQNVLVSTPLLDSPQQAWYGAPRVWGMRVGFRY